MKKLEKPISTSEIFKIFHPTGLITEVLGKQDVEVHRISPVETCEAGDLVFVDKLDYKDTVLKQKPSCIVTSEKLKNLFLDMPSSTILVSPNVGLAHAMIRQKYAARDYTQTGWSGVHETSVIHKTAKLHPTVVVEPRAVIGKNVSIGENTRVMSGVVIENDVEIGKNAILHPNCVIGFGCRLGNEVHVGPGTIIGSEGFGFAQDQKRKSYSIPQTGIVVLEDRVRLGANNCIDRAAFHETRIGSGTKIDNLCHIAHNVKIGQDCLLTAMLCMAGSTEMGDRVMTSGQTGILDHLKICSDTAFVHRAAVTKDIEKPGVYASLPLQPLADYMKSTAVLKNIVELRKKVIELEKENKK